MEVNIRLWRRADLSNIQNVWLDFCRNAARSDMRLRPNAEIAMRDWLTSRFRHPGAFGLIAEDGLEIAGFLIGRIDEWESVPPVIESRRIGIIDAVYVDARFRRLGVGSQLIERAVSKLGDQGAIAVETIYDAWSDASRKTWHHAGFAPWMVHAYRLL